MIINGIIAHPSCFVTMPVYRKLALYDTQYRSVADYDLMLKMFQNSNVKFKPVYHLIANFEMGGMSSTHAAWLELERLKVNHGMITKREYKSIVLKDKLIRMIRGKIVYFKKLCENNFFFFSKNNNYYYFSCIINS